MNKIKNKIIFTLGVISFAFSTSALANTETATVIQVEKNCKHYIAKSSSGFHVVGAINHNAPAKDTQLVGDFSNKGFKDMQIGPDKTPIYMELSFIKLNTLSQAEMELEFKCMESR